MIDLNPRREISPEAFALLGAPDIAYVKPVVTDKGTGEDFSDGHVPGAHEQRPDCSWSVHRRPELGSSLPLLPVIRIPRRMRLER